MSLAFLTPLFLGGLALLVAPYLIHQIRRPEREPMRFSSLMFIPQTRKEVIERRRLQHILLMLIRMAMLTFLAFAFARPYWRTPAAAGVAASGAATWHVILLDASYSMGTGDWFEKARAEGRKILDSVGPADKVGLIVFARTPKVVAPLASGDNPVAGSVAAAREALEAAQITEETTAYVPALQTAQAMFASAESPSANPPARRVVHLISDFQRVGLPEKSSRWKLEPRIELHCAEVGKPDGANCAIEDVSVRETKPGERRVRGEVRNWSHSEKATREVKLIAQGRENTRTALTIEPGAARQVSFQIAADSTTTLEGWLELENDSLPGDNRRYFVRHAARQQRVLLLADENASRSWQATHFLSSALPPKSDAPWRLETQPPANAKNVLLNKEKRPTILIVGDVDRLTPEVTDTIRRYVETGGRLLLNMDGLNASRVLNDGLLAPWGLRSDGPLYSEKRDARFALLSWADFDHPIFFPLRSPQFNDFSSVRFYNYQRLSLPARRADSKADEAPRVLAHFEPDADGREAPAIVEARAGDGRVVIWAFGADLEWSSLPRSVKFIPLFYETLTYLGGTEEQRAWLVGETLRPPKSVGAASDFQIVRLPGETSEIDLKASGAPADVQARHSGFVRWREAANKDGALIEAVNVRAEESNSERIGAEEFQLKLCAPQLEAGPSASPDFERGVVARGFAIRREYWRFLIGLLFASFFLESLCAAVGQVRQVRQVGQVGQVGKPGGSS
jgi:hypothetical protein